MIGEASQLIEHHRFDMRELDWVTLYWLKYETDALHKLAAIMNETCKASAFTVALFRCYAMTISWT